MERTGGPLRARTPVNLARLHIRTGDTDAAVRLLDSLYEAVRIGGQCEIDGRPLDFHNLTTTTSSSSSDDHHTLCRWLWTVVLTEGLRALRVIVKTCG